MLILRVQTWFFFFFLSFYSFPALGNPAAELANAIDRCTGGEIQAARLAEVSDCLAQLKVWIEKNCRNEYSISHVERNQSLIAQAPWIAYHQKIQSFLENVHRDLSSRVLPQDKKLSYLFIYLIELPWEKILGVFSHSGISRREQLIQAAKGLPPRLLDYPADVLTSIFSALSIPDLFRWKDQALSSSSSISQAIEQEIAKRYLAFVAPESQFYSKNPKALVQNYLAQTHPIAAIRWLVKAIDLEEGPLPHTTQLRNMSPGAVAEGLRKLRLLNLSLKNRSEDIPINALPIRFIERLVSYLASVETALKTSESHPNKDIDVLNLTTDPEMRAILGEYSGIDSSFSQELRWLCQRYEIGMDPTSEESIGLPVKSMEHGWVTPSQQLELERVRKEALNSRFRARFELKLSQAEQLSSFAHAFVLYLKVGNSAIGTRSDLRKAYFSFYELYSWREELEADSVYEKLRLLVSQELFDRVARPETVMGIPRNEFSTDRTRSTPIHDQIRAAAFASVAGDNEKFEFWNQKVETAIDSLRGAGDDWLYVGEEFEQMGDFDHAAQFYQRAIREVKTAHAGTISTAYKALQNLIQKKKISPNFLGPEENEKYRARIEPDLFGLFR